MADIPFVDELGRRIESAIRNRNPKHRHGLVVAIGAFAAAVVLLGGVFLWVAVLAEPWSSPTASQHQEVTAKLASVSAVQLVRALPTPGGLVARGEIDYDAATNTVSQKFSTRGDDSLVVATVSIHYRNNKTEIPAVHFSQQNPAPHDTGTITSSNGMTVLEWEPFSGVVIQLVGRGSSSAPTIAQYASEIDRVLAEFNSNSR
ncbi:MAG: hypothetical protein R2823_02625 [Acidimicrobiia bacterium]